MTAYKVSSFIEDMMPSVSRRQQRFMCAEYGRKKSGQRTRTSMKRATLKEFCMARRKKNPASSIRVDPPLRENDMRALKSYLRGLRKERPSYFQDGMQFEYRGSTVTIIGKGKGPVRRTKNPHLTSGKWRFIGMFEKVDIPSVRRILKIHGMKNKVTRDQLKREPGMRELYVERGGYDTAYRAITRLFESSRG